MKEAGKAGEGHEPPRKNALTQMSCHQYVSKSLGIFYFFAPDPKEALETLTERGSPVSGNSPIPPGYARNLSN